MLQGFFTKGEDLGRKSVQSSIPRCGACGLFRSCKSPKMKVYGEGRRNVLVIGEAPGAEEDERGRPFVGESGALLRRVLASHGIDLDRDAWTTNALICRSSKNATPTAKQIDYCRPNLQAALATYEPSVIVTLGKTALTSLLAPFWDDIRDLERWVGWTIPMRRFWLIPTYHPSYLLRMNKDLLTRLFSRHVRKAFSKSLQTVPPFFPVEDRVEVLYEPNEIRGALLQMDYEAGWAAVDYETNCLKPDYEDAYPYSFAVSNGKRTVSFPWTEHVRPAIQEFLASHRTRKIASNLKFEERWTRALFRHGVSNWGWDTMLAAHCLDNRPGVCSIKFQAFVTLGVPAYNLRIEPYLRSVGRYNRIREAPLNDLLIYGGLDALLEYSVAERQRALMGYEAAT